jgi:serine/threonine-protein kinase
VTRPPAPSPTPHPTLQTVPDDTSIAVLPFTCAPADDYLADGVVEDLIDTLSTTPALKVRPSGMVRQRGDVDARALGAQLEVDHVVSGSVRRSGDKLRVSARLLSVADGFQIWARRLDCEESAILDVSEQIARGVAQALSTRAGSSTGAIDPEAVDYFLRAKGELRRFWGEYAEKAKELLEKAALIAPTSGPILSALAFASVQVWMRRGDLAARTDAQHAVERALASGHGEAYLASSNLKLNTGDIDGASTDLGIALARAPMSALAHETVARLLIETDAVDEGLRHFEMAAGLDATREKYVQPDLCRIEALRGNFESAFRRIETLLADPDPAIVQIGSVMEARLGVWTNDVPRIIAAVGRLPKQFRGQGFDLLAIYNKWAATGEFDTDGWIAHARATADPNLPRRTQLASLQRLCETSAMMQQERACEASMDIGIDHGLIDVLWIDRCPVFARYEGATWLTAARRRIRTRAASALAAFRIARG